MLNADWRPLRGRIRCYNLPCQNKAKYGVFILIMPKRGSDFPANININCATSLKQAVITISYLRGGNGQLADVTRDLLTDGVAAYIAGLDERRRRDFEDILATVKARDALTDNKKAPT